MDQVGLAGSDLIQTKGPGFPGPASTGAVSGEAPHRVAWHDGTVTAPLTPPHQPGPHDPWQAPPSGSHLAPYSGAPDDPDTATELRQAAVVAVLVAVSGIALGLLWLWLAPRVPLVSDDTAVFLKNSEGEEAIGADGTFVLLAIGFGVLSAVLVFWRLRRGGVLVVAGLALGAVLASLIAWRVGVWLGPSSDVVGRAREAGAGRDVRRPAGAAHGVGGGAGVAVRGDGDPSAADRGVRAAGCGAEWAYYQGPVQGPLEGAGVGSGASSSAGGGGAA